jgi:hypothetical protein
MAARCLACGRWCPPGHCYCSRRCQARGRQVRVPVGVLLSALNSGRPWECVAADLHVSRVTLWRVVRRAGIVRIGGPARHVGGVYAATRRDGQLAWW